MSSLGKTRVGRWYWNLDGKGLAYFLVIFNILVGTPFFLWALLSGVPWYGAIVIACIPMALGNSALSIYNISKM